MKRKLSVLVLTGVLAIGALAGCGNANEESGNPTATPTVEPTTALTEALEGVSNTEVNLGEYKGITLTNITKEEVDASIAEVLAEYASDFVVEKAAEEGDIVNINYVGTKDGVAFSGGTDSSEAGTNLTLGSGTFIAGFEEGLIGAVAGEVRDLNLTFPENYTNTDLAGQAVVFTVTVNYVMAPELTDEFAVNYMGYETAEEAWQAAYDVLNEEYLYTQISKILMTTSELVAYPEEEVQLEAQGMVDYYISYAEYYASMFGSDLETMLLYRTGFSSVEALEEYAYKYAYMLTKNELVLTAIAIKEDIAVTDEIYAERVQDYVVNNGYSDVESLEADYGVEVIRTAILGDMVMEFVLENAVITDAE